MGSGSSKEKKPLPNSGGTNRTNASPSKVQQKQDIKRQTGSNNSQVVSPTKTNGASVTQQNTNQQNTNHDRNNYNNSGNNVNNKSVSRKSLGNFESDSEEEDIDAVLEATRNEHNANKMREQNRLQDNNNEPSYPETYAQRLQREHYKQEPQGILRQKTIYRNPDDWEIEENEVENFDISRFKQANVMKNPPTIQNTHDDIFSPPGVNNTETTNGHLRSTAPDLDTYYALPKQKKKSLPHYDTSEEALLDEIEKEFEL